MDFTFLEKVYLLVLLKSKALENLKDSKNTLYKEEAREVFRKDFHRWFNMYKKVAAATK